MRRTLMLHTPMRRTQTQHTPIQHRPTQRTQQQRKPPCDQPSPDGVLRDLHGALNSHRLTLNCCLKIRLGRKAHQPLLERLPLPQQGRLQPSTFLQNLS
ncbi:hypothetical protein EH31_01160 [Erythrobacter longus]|uniref:Uncharacterized protein n=1 Tax=Erythrobacter longus TaxID=1044 RepID=A0A074MEV8_ERYLO|nr:hypothetical protein EH31_01160 [Erythrobacter longus]